MKRVKTEVRMMIWGEEMYEMEWKWEYLVCFLCKVQPCKNLI